MSNMLENTSPIIYATKSRNKKVSDSELDPNIVDPINVQEIFDYIRDINDPEHPLTLEQLNVVQEELIVVDSSDDETIVVVGYVPTIPHCSMATLIGLAIRTKLQRSLHPSIKVVVKIAPDTHISADAINKQLADKERVAAALENSDLLRAVNQCLTPNAF